MPAPAAAARAYRRPLSISVGIAAALLLVGGGYLAFEPGKSGKAVPVDLVAEVQRAREALAVASNAPNSARKRKRKCSARRSRRSRTDSAPRKRRRRAAAAELERDRAEAEAARQKAEQEAVRLKAEAEARQRAEFEAEARRTAEVGQAEKNCLEQETSARAEAAKAAIQQKLDDEQSKADAEKAAAAQMRRDNDKKTAEAVENVLRLSQVDRQRIQLALTSLGFDSVAATASWDRVQSRHDCGLAEGEQSGPERLPSQPPRTRRCCAKRPRRSPDTRMINKPDEGKKKADEARTTAAAAPSIPPRWPHSAAANPFDGIYSGSYTQASGTAFGMAIRSVSICIAGGAGTGTVTHLSSGCHSGFASCLFSRRPLRRSHAL